MATNNRSSSRETSSRMAFCGLTTALSVTIMLAGGLIPIATYCVPMISSVLLLAVLAEFGKRAAWTTYLSTSIISILLAPDKEAAFFYVFMGFYPILKWQFDRIQPKWLRILSKFMFFSLSIILMYIVLGFILNMHAIVAEFSEMGVYFTFILLLLFDLCMFLYDRLLFPLIFLYGQRIQPRLRFLTKR